LAGEDLQPDAARGEVVDGVDEMVQVATELSVSALVCTDVRTPLHARRIPPDLESTV
jgi:hypothetical protein